MLAKGKIGQGIQLYPLLPLAISFVLGIRCFDWVKLHYTYLFLPFLLLLLGEILLHYRSSISVRTHTGIFLLLFFWMGYLRMAVWYDAVISQPYIQNLPLQGVTLRGEVISLDTTRHLKVVMTLRKIKKGTISVKTGGKILVFFPEGYSSTLFVGQEIILSPTDLQSLPLPRNPGQFDYATYLKRRGIVAQCFIREAEQIRLSAPNHFSLERILFSPLRRILVHRMNTFLSADVTGFLKALLLGQRESLDSKIIEEFQKAGVMHVLAISGLHVAYVVLILYVVLSFLPLFFKWQNLIIVTLLLFYMALTGAHSPVVRATLMAGLYFLSINLERPISIYNLISAAAIIILMFQPQQLFWVGFQFSFIAVLSIIYFYEKLTPMREKLLAPLPNETIRKKVHRWIFAPFFVSFAAQLGTIPLTMHYFHKFSPIAFVLNIIVIPFIGFVVALGFLFLFFSFVSGALAGLLANFLEGLVRLLILMVDKSLAVPVAYFTIPRFNLLYILLYFTILFLIIYFKNRLFRRIFIFFALTFLLIMGTERFFSSKRLNLIIMDVGQGDAALLITPERKSILIDCGPATRNYNAADAALLPVIQELGLRKVNYLFISHPHSDHIGGAFRLLELLPVDSVFLPPISGPYRWQDSLLHVLSRKAIPFRFLRIGNRVFIDSEARVYVLAPLKTLPARIPRTGRNLNNHSLVLLIRYRDHQMLFPGDVEETTEGILTHWQDILRSDFLKVPHHGSNTSTTALFLSLVNPRFATISVGRMNRFGHPSLTVVKRLQAVTKNTFRTDKNRALWFRIERDRWHRVDW